jgi:serine/threonine protein kinase
VDSPDTLIAPSRASAGAAVLGRYRLLERLGAGGFGVVWRAHDALLDREVAVKAIPLPAGEDHERAAREALAAARLAHPAIVALYEACVEDDAFYLISELVHGETLAELIAAEALCDEEVLEIGVALADALLHAHSRGVVHRDIKPQNVLVPARRGPAGGRGSSEVRTWRGGGGAPEPEEDSSRRSDPPVKLTDFGGALLAGEQGLTRTGDVLGTLAYMAPEQIEGHEVDEQADLYSLALVLYEALSGVNPVRGPTPAATARRIGRELPPLERHRRDLPRGLTRALDRALDPEPQERGSLSGLGEALSHALHSGLRRSRWQRHASASDTARGRPARADLEGPVAARDRPFSARADSQGPVVAHYPLLSAQADLGGTVWARDRPFSARADPVEPAPTRHQPRRSAPATAEGPPPGRSPEHLGEAPDSSGWLTLPRLLWLAGALSVCGWQLTAGRPGFVPVALCALAPLVLLVRRPGPRWLLPALAPVLGLVGLAGAFPALAGQAAHWRSRALLGALGYWWLRLAELPLDGPTRRLWLGPPAALAGSASWEGSLGAAVLHAIVPLLSLALLLGVVLWAAAAALLPWIVRGHSAALDALAAILWAGALAVAGAGLGGAGLPPLLGRGLSVAHAAGSGLQAPRGAVLGAALGGVLAVAARALRGPV